MSETAANPKAGIDRALPWLLSVCGFIGFLASFILTVDKMKLLQNPHYIPSCSLNPIISCGSVMKSSQASVFGFTNSLLGVGAFAALTLLGISLLAGASYRKWFWRTAQTAALFGLGFVGWLIFQSLYRIHSLCPFCMVVWLVTLTTFWYLLLRNLRHGVIVLPRAVTRFFINHHFDIWLLIVLVLAGLILHNFWYYFRTLA